MSAFSDRLERIAQNKQQPKSNFQKRLARVNNGQGIGAESEMPEFEKAAKHYWMRLQII